MSAANTATDTMTPAPGKNTLTLTDPNVRRAVKGGDNQVYDAPP
jgi:hypothetical protein